jgi:hypothetical protein
MRPPRRPAFLDGSSPKAPQGAFGKHSVQPLMKVVPFLSPALEGLPEPIMEPLPPPPPRAPAPPPPPTFPPELASRLVDVIGALRGEAVRVREQAVEDTVELAILVARHLLERELGGSREDLRTLVRTAIERLPEPRRVIVRVSPRDADVLRRHARSSSAEGEEDAGDERPLAGPNTVVEIVADSSLSAGDVDIEADEGSVDARLVTRLETLRHALLEALEARPGEEQP